MRLTVIGYKVDIEVSFDSQNESKEDTRVNSKQSISENGNSFIGGQKENSGLKHKGKAT